MATAGASGRCDQAADARGRGHTESADERPEARREWQASKQRCVSEPRQWAHHESHAAERDREECPDDVWVELRACAAGDLCAAVLGCRCLLVGTRRGDHVERVCDGDDATGERDLFALEPERVARSVPPFVVRADGLRPFSEPVADRRDELGAELRMAAEDVPLVVGRPSVLGEDRAGHLELADVVQQRRPVEQVELVARQAELLADHHRVGTHALAVTARQAVVDVERGDQLEQDRCCLARCGSFGRCLRRRHTSG